MRMLLLANVVLGTLSTIQLQADIWHVDAHASGASNGRSWSDAFTDLQEALEESQYGDQIWVAEGVYNPGATRNDREGSFHLKDGVAIYGGFLGFESSADERLGAAANTILSGDNARNDHASYGRCCVPTHSVSCDDLECSGSVCAVDPYCCQVGWDAQCVARAQELCPDICDSLMDNAYHVVQGHDLSRKSIIDNFVIEGGVADTAGHDNGAGLYITDSMMIVRRVIARNHRAHRFGASAYIDGGAPRIKSCRFKDSVTNSHAYGGTGTGGAVYLNKSRAQMSNCTIERNQSGAFGGGIACYGGAPELNQCRISHNQASIAGGLYLEGSQARVRHCVISNNLGGGVFCDTAFGMDEISNCTIVGNVASKGAGIYCSGSNSPVIRNCLIARNDAANTGGGIQCDIFSHATILNCTIVDNRAWNPAFGGQGGGIYLSTGSSPTVTSSIVWGNEADAGSEVYLAVVGASPSVTFKYCTVVPGQDKIFDPVSGVVWGPGNVDRDPQFLDRPGHDYHITKQSPCVNRGDPNYVTVVHETDIDRQIRVQRKRIDIGCDEWQPVAGAGAQLSGHDATVGE